MMFATMLLCLQDPIQENDRRMSLALERLERVLDQAAVDLLKAGEIPEARRRMADVFLNQIAYLFNVMVREYMSGKRDAFSPEMDEAEKILKDIASQKQVEGDWLARAAHARIVPRVRRHLTPAAFSSPWSACNGTEKDCMTCEVIRKGQ